jgi:Fe-S-cluster-containing dehydrogenase component
MARWGMVIDLDKCTACQACVVACKAENNVPFSTPQQAERNHTMFWMQLLAHVEGEYPRVKGTFIPLPCMHCDEPPCVQVCPVKATWKREDGLVIQDYERCIGCKYCMVACPYGVRHMNAGKFLPPESLTSYANPDSRVVKRRVGIVEKCTFCVHRLEQAKAKAKAQGREVRDGDYTTACQQTCTGGAIKFGDLDDPKSEVYRLSRDKRAWRLLEELGTQPRLYYLKEG